MRWLDNRSPWRSRIQTLLSWAACLTALLAVWFALKPISAFILDQASDFVGTNVALSERRAKETLVRVVGFETRGERFIFGWRNCCEFDYRSNILPASRCAVFQLQDAEFDRIHKHQYSRVNWKDSGCWPRGGMKGCSEFRRNNSKLDFVFHGDTCSGPDGTILSIDVQNRMVMAETYTFD